MLLITLPKQQCFVVKTLISQSDRFSGLGQLAPQFVEVTVQLLYASSYFLFLPFHHRVDEKFRLNSFSKVIKSSFLERTSCSLPTFSMFLLFHKSCCKFSGAYYCCSDGFCSFRFLYVPSQIFGLCIFIPSCKSLLSTEYICSKPIDSRPCFGHVSINSQVSYV